MSPSSKSILRAFFADPSDPAARDRFVKKYIGVINSWSRGIVHNPHNAEELTQEFFIHLFCKETIAFDSQRESYRPWLYVVLRRIAATINRRKELGLISFDMNPIDDPALTELANGIEEIDRADLFDFVVAKLKHEKGFAPKSWSIFDRFRNGEELRDIALDLGMNYESTHRDYRRIVAAVKDGVQRELDM